MIFKYNFLGENEDEIKKHNADKFTLISFLNN